MAPRFLENLHDLPQRCQPAAVASGRVLLRENIPVEPTQVCDEAVVVLVGDPAERRLGVIVAKACHLETMCEPL